MTPQQISEARLLGNLTREQTAYALDHMGAEMSTNLMRADVIGEMPVEPTVAEDPSRAAWIGGMREVCDWLEAHPEVPLPYIGAHVSGSPLPSLPIYLHKWNPNKPDVRTQMATIARAMGKATKSPGLVDGTYIVWRAFDGVALYAQAERDEVCERIVVGTREVKDLVPDPERVAAVPLVEVTKTIEDVEWRCGSILAAESPEDPR